MSDSSLLHRLKERKLVQWALAYLAGAFVVFQLLDALAEPLGLTPPIQQAVLVVVGIGFFVTLVLAWYHGEKGRQRVSGPELLMVAALLVIAGGVLVMLRDGGDSSEAAESAVSPVSEDSRPRIAVLPCTNMSPDPTDEYLAASLHYEILLRLQGISSLFSMGRASVEWYRVNPAPLTQIAQELRVGFVGECSVQKAGRQIRFIFNLLDGPTGGHIWAEDYDRNLTAQSLFDIQSDIATEVARAVGAVLTPEERAGIQGRNTESSEAYESYLRGRFFLSKRTQESIRAAQQHFLESVARDSAYALGYSGLADSYAQSVGYGVLPDSEALPRGLAAAARATELDPNSGEAQLSFSWINYHLRGCVGDLEAGFERAIDLSPGTSNAYHWYGWYLACRNRFEEAEAFMREALDLDPLSLVYNASLGWLLLTSGDFDGAVSHLEATLELDETFPRTHFFLGRALVFSGQSEDAIYHLSRAVELSERHPQYLATLGWAYGAIGEQAQARAVLDELMALSPDELVNPYYLVFAHLGVEEEERALDYLEEDLRSPGIPLVIHVDRRLAPLRDHPRFQALLERYVPNLEH